MKRTERLFALAEALRARRTGVTAEALAERFDVSVRTVYRDLDALKMADLPLLAERGPGGGFALDRSYSLPPVNFTAREAALLATVGRWATELRVVPFDETVTRALDKVRAALPPKGQRELERLERELTFVGVPAHTASLDVRRAVETALFERRPLAIVYQSARGEVTERRVRIRSIVMERSETRINTEDVDKGEDRQFRLDGIVRAEVLSDFSPEGSPKDAPKNAKATPPASSPRAPSPGDARARPSGPSPTARRSRRSAHRR